MALTIAVAQCNPVAGDLAGNTRLIVDAARKAHAQGAQLLLLPDGAFTGVPLRDLARRPVFVQACEHQLQTLRVELASLEGLVVVMTSLDPDTGGCAQKGAQPHPGAVWWKNGCTVRRVAGWRLSRRCAWRACRLVCGEYLEQHERERRARRWRSVGGDAWWCALPYGFGTGPRTGFGCAGKAF